MGKAKAIFAALAILAVVTFAASVHAAKAVPVFDGRNWKLGWSQNQGSAVFEEYVLDGESVENWTELVTIQFMPGLNEKTNPDIFEAANRRDLSAVCPDIRWNSISQGEDRMWEWSIQGCQGQPDQSEIARLVRTGEGYHMFHYAIKKSPMPADKREVWIENLKAISAT